MSRRLDRLTLLATFARIAERGSISAAARDLGLTQASASRQLAELERQLSARLIHRTTHSLALTEAGRGCLAGARSLLDGWDALTDRVADDGHEIRGPLKVVAPVALGQLHLADAALDFQLAHPAVSITWLLQDDTIRFAEIGCDLWIKIGRVPDDSLVVRPLGRVERIVVAATGLIEGRRVQTPADLARLPSVALEPFEGGVIPLTNTEGALETVTARAAIATNNLFAARKAALGGVGYTVMPRWFVEEDLTRGTLIDVLPTWRAPSLTINAAYLPAGRQTRRLSQFIEHVATAISGLAGIGPPG